MLKIRLQRIGRKNQPLFRFVVTDSKNSTKSGKFLEVLGNYDSRKGEDAQIKTDRVAHWIDKGAQLSLTVHNFLVGKKAIEGKKLNALPKKKPIIKDAPLQAEAPTQTATEESTPVEEGTTPEVTTEVEPTQAPEETPAEVVV